MTEEPRYDIELTRVFDAPRERIYKAFTDSDEFARWYGPVGFPGHDDPWPSHLRVEFHDEDGKTRLVLREGPHPAGTAEMGRGAWQMMFAKLDTLLADSA